ncbi:hypothetical protein LZ009_09665 [Ramlibacter sp. XY19]|uniref:hypothetical protein n=1 Tax=Ramlibacter paludis TaxID=2908000 RepID=UPI0023DBCCCA|nr:hypothetical protein [Ramlibacter paludis]MCG2593047.1 hypothetical protein [Ramlibacter paludis]
MASAFTMRQLARFNTLLSYRLIALVPVLGLLGQLPARGQLPGYFTLYFPFLLIGSLAYLVEHGKASRVALVAIVCLC